MAAKVILTATHGIFKGRTFAFSEPVTFTLGRAVDCSLQLPNHWADMTISRHHCELVIDPPLWVRDLGSSNGTFVNGKLIGGRDSRRAGKEHELHDGDELRLGDAAFVVSITEATEADRCPCAELASVP
jgi:eukaryotic-like serine/threonine-protein kinase